MKNIAFLVLASALGYAGTVSAHETHASHKHHHHVHHHAAKVAAGQTTPEQAVNVMVKDEDFKHGLVNDVKVHADEIKRSGTDS